MRIKTLEEEEMYQAIAERHNPPVIQNQKEENQFQDEIRRLYGRLVELLSPFGEEGDYYGVSDFAVRPDLRDRATVTDLAPHAREFTITILTESFFRSDYLAVLHKFLTTEAPAYRIWIDKDFDPSWSQTIILTANQARVRCTNVKEASRLNSVLAEL